MGSTSAARRRAAREPDEPPDDGAEIRRVVAETDAILGRMRHHGGRIAAGAAALEQLAAECPNAGRLAFAADKLSARLALQVIETISAAAHFAELRQALERSAAAAERSAETATFTEAMRQAAIAGATAPLLAEIAELRKALGSRPRAAGAHRRRHLKLAGSIIPATAAAASLVAGGAVITAHDSASVHHLTSPRPAAVRMHQGPDDSAVRVPQAGPSSSSPRPSVAAASASPAPKVSPSPSPVTSSPPPAPSPTATATTAPDPVLDVPRFLDLGDSILGRLPLTAGAQAVTWTATAKDGITLSSYGGVVLAGQTVTLQVSDPPAGGGWIYISAGTEMFAVHVTSSLGVPVLGL